MPKKGENIYNRKDGRWEGRYIRSYIEKAQKTVNPLGCSINRKYL